MANDKKFVVKNGLQANNVAFVNESNSATVITASMLSSDVLSFSGNSGQLFSISDTMSGVIFAVNDISGVPSIEVDDTGDIRLAELSGNVSIGTSLDTHKLYVQGNTYVNGSLLVGGTVINSTVYSGTANNATYLNGQLASYYTNATNITTGTLPYAQIPANVVNTTANFTIAGAWTFNANATFGAADHIILSSTSGISANGSYGTSGQMLTSNGTAVYWSTPQIGDITAVTAGNGLTGGGTSGDVTVNVGAGTGITVNADDIAVNAAYIATITSNNATFFGGYTWAAPGALGTSTANSGAFTTVSAGNTTITGFANVISDSAVLCVGNATSFSTANTSGFYPVSNTLANALGSATQRWALNATTGSFAGAVSGITTLAAGNTTITGWTNITGNANVAGDLIVTSETIGVRTRFISGKTSPGNTAGPLYIQYSSSDFVQVGGGTGSANFYVANGSLGVGTTSPSQPVHIIANSVSADLNQHLLAEGSTQGILGLKVTGGNLWTVRGNPTGLYTRLTGTGDLFTILSSGNTGIGNTSPADKLSVNGTTYLGGNTTIAGFANVTGTVNAATLSVGTNFVANSLGVTTSNVSATNLTLTGNLTVGGTTTTVSAQNLSVTDNMIYMNNGVDATITGLTANGTAIVFTANNNFAAGWDVVVTGVTPSAYNATYSNITAANSTTFTVSSTTTGAYTSGGTARGKTDTNPDIGFAAGYNDGTYQHAGFFRDATDDYFKPFKGYTPEPDASPFIDTTNTSFTLAGIHANDLRLGNTTVYATINSTSYSGSANNSTYLAGQLGSYYAANSQLANYALLSGATFTGAVSGITTLAAGNTTITGFANVSTSLQTGTNTATFGTAAYIVANGNVGIGTNAPPVKLTVTGRVQLTSDYPDVRMLTSSGYGWRVAGGSNGTNLDKLYFQSSSDNFATAASPMVIDSGGNVGIGPLTPGYKLEVSGTIGAGNTTITGFANVISDSAVLRVGNATSFSTANTSGFYPVSNTLANALGSATQRWALNATTGSFAGAVSGITTLAAGNTTVTGFANVTSTIQGGAGLTIAGAASGITTLAAGNTTITGFANVSTTLQVGTNTATFGTAAYIVSNGNIGVGNTTPAYKIQVDGTGFFGNTVTIQNGVDKKMQFVRSGANTFSIEHDTSRIYFYNSSTANTILVFTNDSNVGIGTGSPAYKLEVNGSFAATTKSFVIDHPTKEGMKLRYGSLEGPENGVYVRGRLRGSNIIELPDYWTGLVDEDTITVNLTAVGKSQNLYVAYMGDGFIRVENETDTNIDCFYTVFAERKDVEKLEVEF